MSLRASAAYIATRIASGALAMLTLALVVRGLGPERYGQLSLALAAAAAVTLVLFNPINASLARFFAEADRRVPLLSLLRGTMLGIGALLIALAGMLELSGLSPFARGVLLAAACLALAQGMFDFSGQYLAAAQRSARYSFQFLSKALLACVLSVLAVQAGWGALGVLLAMGLAFLIAAMLAGDVWRPGAGVQPSSAASQPGFTGDVARFAGPLLLTSLLGYLLLWGDRYLLGHLVPLAELGIYSALTDLAMQTLGLLFSGLCTAWYPRLVRAWAGGERAEVQRLFERYGALGLAICLPAGLGFALILPDLLPVLYGPAYSETAPGLLALVSAAAVMAGVKAYYFDQPLLLAKRVWWHAASIALSAGGGLLLAAVLVPEMGTPGAALGLLLGQLAGAGLSAWAGRDAVRLRIPFGLCWPPVLAALCMAALLLAWPVAGWVGVLAKCAGGAAVYACVMWLADFDGLRGRFSCRSGLWPLLHIQAEPGMPRRIVLFANTDWFLFNFKLSLARALRARGDEVLLLSPLGEYGPRLRELGFRWEPLPVSRSGVNPLAELAVIRRITRLYREVKPDLVHHFTIKCVIYGSFAARRAGVGGVVNSVTGLGFALLADTLKARLIRPVVLALYRLALRGTQVIFQNRDNRDTLAGYGVLGRSGVQVIAGDGIDTARFVPATDEGGEGLTPGAASGQQPPVVLMMARLLHSKGIAVFVAAAERVRALRPDVVFRLAGAPDPGNPESVTEAELDAWRAGGAVEFLGQRSDVLALNQSASIVVLASTQGEGIPRALLEGAACAVPMVATDVPGCRDVVVTGETGLLVPPGDAGALAAALLELLQDEALRVQMGRAARRHVEASFSDQVVIGQTLAVYERAARKMGV